MKEREDEEKTKIERGKGFSAEAAEETRHKLTV